MSKEETEEITWRSATASTRSASSKAAPLVLRLGNKGTLVLQLAMISSCCAAFVAPFASPRVQVACWCMLRIFTAMAFPSLVAFVRNWFPRNAYGRVWGFLNSGFQSGYFLASLGYGPLVARGALGWRTPFEVVAALGAASPSRASGLLQNKPRPLAPPPPPAAPPPPGAERAERAEQKAKGGRRTRGGGQGGDGGEAGGAAGDAPGDARAARRRAEGAHGGAARALGGARGGRGARGGGGGAPSHRAGGRAGTRTRGHARDRPGRRRRQGGAVDRAGGGRGRPSFAVLLRRFASRWQFWAMIVACACYSPIVEFGTYLSSYLKEIEGAKAFPACIASAGCERRYRIYVASYVTSLLAGSFIYDRCSQLDKALLVVLCYCINIGCWGTLALAEAPRSAALGLEAATPRWYPRAEWAAPAPGGARGTAAAALGQVARRGGRLRLDCDPVVAPVCDVRDGLWEGGRRDAVVDPVGGRLWREPPLPPPLPAAAEAARMARRLRYPRGARAHGGPRDVVDHVLRLLEVLTRVHHHLLLLNETVVTLHACEKCTFAPMWRPGARRTYSYAAAKRNYSPLRPHAPTRRCHLCGRRTVVECKVGEAFAELSLMTPYAQCDAWVRERTPLRKGDGGWAFADPTRYPLAPKKTYGDERAYQLRIAMERRAAEGIAEEATDEAVEAALGDTI